MSESIKSPDILFERMVEQVKDYAILSIDLEGVIQNWNVGAEKIKGYSEAEIIGRNFNIFYPEEDRQSNKPRRFLEHAILNGSIQDEGWRIRKDGSMFWASVTITAIQDVSGKTVGFTKVTRDLTSKKEDDAQKERLIQELQSKNKDLEQFSYITSHDLQEPLRTIRSFIALIEEVYGHLMDDESRTYFSFINSAADRMSDLIKGLLDYNRIGRKSFRESVDCSILLDEVLVDLDTVIRESNVEIEVIPVMPVIDAYKVELRLLFQNLISNGVKFQDGSRLPRVWVSCEDVGDSWRFSVRDNGIGISVEDSSKVFLIFKRLHNHDEYDGSGIGLAHCKKIVDLHGGTIWIDSVLGEGTVFHILLPKVISDFDER